MLVNHAKEYLIFVHTCVVFLHFLARASNGRQYSNFENKCPKLGTGTPEHMVLTNLGDNLDSDPSGFVLDCGPKWTQAVNKCLLWLERSSM